MNTNNKSAMADDNEYNNGKNQSPKSLDTYLEGGNGKEDDAEIIQNRGYDITKDLAFNIRDKRNSNGKKDDINNNQNNTIHTNNKYTLMNISGDKDNCDSHTIKNNECRDNKEVINKNNGEVIEEDVIDIDEND
jgi:hypothetical protein